MKKILIAGAGHGGLVAGAYLAEQGYQVEVFEKSAREDLGHDWHDTMRYNTLEIAGVKDVQRSDYELRKDNTFYPPSLKIAVSVPPPKYEHYDINMDRKVLYNYLIQNATDKGVIINYNQKVQRPHIVNDKVAGLVVDGKTLLGDLVIDSAGMYSSVMKNLPSSYNINVSYGAKDVFSAYRAYFNLEDGQEIINEDRFNVYFNFSGVSGLAWFKVTMGNLADVIVGSVNGLTIAEAEKVVENLRKVQPAIGKQLVRGGSIGLIPLKYTSTKFVGDNYAALGDAASMPYPINGSGITHSITAGKILAETIIDIDQNQGNYSVEALWDYQVKYYHQIGHQMLSVYLMKNYLLSLPNDEMNFLFEKKILTDKELGSGAEGENMQLSFKDILQKVVRGISRPKALLCIKSVAETANKLQQIGKSIPTKYNESAIAAWQQAIQEVLKKFQSNYNIAN